MRISDWSSYVFSSDLLRHAIRRQPSARGKRAIAGLQYLQRTLAGRRREGAVEFGEVVGRQRHVEGGTVVAHMLRGGGLGAEDQVVPAQQPCPCRLRRRDPVPAGIGRAACGERVWENG